MRKIFVQKTKYKDKMRIFFFLIVDTHTKTVSKLQIFADVLKDLPKESIISAKESKSSK